MTDTFMKVNIWQILKTFVGLLLSRCLRLGIKALVNVGTALDYDVSHSGFPASSSH